MLIFMAIAVSGGLRRAIGVSGSLRRMKKTMKPYPNKVCIECGNKYGRSRSSASCYHMNNCDVCGKKKAVTQSRDYGYPNFPGHKSYYDSLTPQEKEEREMFNVIQYIYGNLIKNIQR
jgi:hypothetical protein